MQNQQSRSTSDFRSESNLETRVQLYTTCLIST